LKKFFINWTCGNEEIDNLIKRKQLKIESMSELLEFIPYHQFNDIKEINKSDVATVYSAMWKDGPLLGYGFDRKWTRELNKKVYLILYSLQNTDLFLNEV
jgi:hypothetical protein